METDNPDLRDRAYIYWRLLSTDPEVLFLALESELVCLQRCIINSIAELHIQLKVV